MKKQLLIILSIVLFLLSSCTGMSAPAKPVLEPSTKTPESSPNSYSLNVIISPENGGRVIPENTEYSADSTITLNAIPNQGFIFDHWSGDLSGSSNTLVFSIKGDTQLTAHFLQLATPTPTAIPSPTPEPCRKPSEVRIEDEGKILEVCGEVTNWGNVPCINCPRGGYSFIKLESEFLIISYDWVFNNDWIGLCIQVADSIEILGTAPIFIFGKGEGYANSECTFDETDGSISCQTGEYFQTYFECKNQDE